jgi:hypothetical protein
MISTQLSYLTAREKHDDLAARAERASSLPPRSPRTVPPVVDALAHWLAELGIGPGVRRARGCVGRPERRHTC